MFKFSDAQYNILKVIKEELKKTAEKGRKRVIKNSENNIMGLEENDLHLRRNGNPHHCHLKMVCHLYVNKNFEEAIYKEVNCTIGLLQVGIIDCS